MAGVVRIGWRPELRPGDEFAADGHAINELAWLGLALAVPVERVAVLEELHARYGVAARGLDPVHVHEKRLAHEGVQVEIISSLVLRVLGAVVAQILKPVDGKNPNLHLCFAKPVVGAVLQRKEQ